MLKLMCLFLAIAIGSAAAQETQDETKEQSTSNSEKGAAERVFSDAPTSLIDHELIEWKRKYPLEFDGVSEEFPEIEDKSSSFRILFGVKLKIAEEKNDPKLKNIDFVRQIAKTIPRTPLKASQPKTVPLAVDSGTPGELLQESKLLDEMEKMPPFDNAGKGRLVVSNGVGSHAIVKLIVGPKKAFSFYIKPGDSFTLDFIPDNSYRVIFAFSEDGKIRGKDNFSNKSSVAEFQDGLAFETKLTRLPDKIVTNYSSWSLTLYAVNHGNAKTKKLDDAEFDRF